MSYEDRMSELESIGSEHSGIQATTIVPAARRNGRPCLWRWLRRRAAHLTKQHRAEMAPPAEPLSGVLPNGAGEVLCDRSEREFRKATGGEHRPIGRRHF